MNCVKYANKALIQKRTWLPLIPSHICYYHVVGDPAMNVAYHFDHDNRVLRIRVEDDYTSLPKKVIRAYEAVCQVFEFQYVYKTDDDQMMVNEQLFDTLQEAARIRPKIHYGGFVVNVKQDHISEYYKIHPELPKNLVVKKTHYCSGRFYFLSKQAISFLLSNKSAIESEYFEDYAIGFHLAPYFKQNAMHILTHNFFHDIEQLLREEN